jgi:hypothetical protein
VLLQLFVACHQALLSAAVALVNDGYVVEMLSGLQLTDRGD